MLASRKGVIRMKDFKDFELLLASDECADEIRGLVASALQESKNDGDDSVTMAASAAIAVSQYELRKYHEWVNLPE